MTNTEENLQKALIDIREERETDYGSPETNFKFIAALWSVWLQVPVTAVDVAQMMSLLKKARMKTGKAKLDNVVDDIRYTELAWRLKGAEMKGDSEE